MYGGRKREEVRKGGGGGQVEMKGNKETKERKYRNGREEKGDETRRLLKKRNEVMKI